VDDVAASFQLAEELASWKLAATSFASLEDSGRATHQKNKARQITRRKKSRRSESWIHSAAFQNQAVDEIS
jgi:hypothetical protein